jgi:hypothetical protein
MLLPDVAVCGANRRRVVFRGIRTALPVTVPVGGYPMERVQSTVKCGYVSLNYSPHAPPPAGAGRHNAAST